MILRLLFSLLLFLGVATQATANCRPDVVQLRGDWGQARFNVELAETPEDRAQGLMHRESLPASSGMLFLYERPQVLSFWMRNTLIELDMLFLDPDGVVRYIHHRAQPLDENPVFGGDGLIAVLEINGGLSKAMGIGEGSQLRHPFFGPDAAWPCPQ